MTVVSAIHIWEHYPPADTITICLTELIGIIADIIILWRVHVLQFCQFQTVFERHFPSLFPVASFYLICIFLCVCLTVNLRKKNNVL